mgnify:CR=1 FL=1
MMKSIILSIFCMFMGMTAAYSQNGIDFSERAQKGQLSFDECMSVDSTNFEVIIPSLIYLKRSYEEAGTYNGTMYSRIVMYLNYYYTNIGDFASSRQLLNEAANTFNLRESEPNNEYYRYILVCRGQLEVMLKNYGNALNYLNIAQQYYEEKNDYSESYMIMMHNMALSYMANGDTLSSKIYMDEAIEQFEKLHGSIYDNQDENYFIILSNYGYICNAIGHNNEAEKCFLAVINNSKRTPMSYDTYILACNNLSTMYMKQGRWLEGAKLLEGLESANGERNYMLAQNLALCYLYLKEYPKSVSSLLKLNNVSLLNLEKIFSHFTDLERENYWKEISRELIFVNNLIAYQTKNQQAISEAYNNALFCKDLLVNSSRLIDSIASQSSDLTLREHYLKYKELKNKLAYKTDNKLGRDSIAREIIEEERQLLASIGNLGQLLKERSKVWQDVKASLEDGEVAIEYCYAPRMENYPDMQPYYGAFVMRKDFDFPLLISLENVDSVESVFGDIESDPLMINDLYASNKSVILYNMLWSKLTQHLNGINTVYYSTAGPLSTLNFEVLYGDDGKMLNEKYAMRRVSSTANICNEKQSASVTLHSSVLYGNIDYEESEEEMAQASETYKSFTGTSIGNELTMRSENDRGRWGLLPSTKNEIENIRRLLLQKNVYVTTLEDNAANEESFKQLSGSSPDILHLATHGFVIDTQQKAEGNRFVESTNVYSQKESYMMWAGLLMAGANNVWQGKFSLENVEDGVLTADEISRLDLSNTKLAVLSACETARGKIDPVDGVYGLQRALKIAGVQTIVMSLWKVQDDATSMLMTQFYTYLTSGVERHQALWKSMMDVRKKYKEPYYWAGFVMLD